MQSIVYPTQRGPRLSRERSSRTKVERFAVTIGNATPYRKPQSSERTSSIGSCGSRKPREIRRFWALSDSDVAKTGVGVKTKRVRPPFDPNKLATHRGDYERTTTTTSANGWSGTIHAVCKAGWCRGTLATFALSAWNARDKSRQRCPLCAARLKVEVKKAERQRERGNAKVAA